MPEMMPLLRFSLALFSVLSPAIHASQEKSSKPDPIRQFVDIQIQTLPETFQMSATVLKIGKSASCGEKITGTLSLESLRGRVTADLRKRLDTNEVQALAVWVPDAIEILRRREKDQKNGTSTADEYLATMQANNDPQRQKAGAAMEGISAKASESAQAAGTAMGAEAGTLSRSNCAEGGSTSLAPARRMCPTLAFDESTLRVIRVTEGVGNRWKIEYQSLSGSRSTGSTEVYPAVRTALSGRIKINWAGC